MTREELEEKYGKDNVWDTDELRIGFEVQSFLAPMVVVVRKSDNVKGSMFFQHHPRYYFDFKEV